MPQQLDMIGFSALFHSPPDDESEREQRLEVAKQEVRSRIAEVAEYHGHEQLSIRLGMKNKQYFSDALAGRNGKRFDLIQHLPVLIAEAPNDDLTDTLVSIREEPASDREALVAALEAAQEYLGPEAQRGYMRTVKRVMNKNRRLRRVG